MFAIIVHFNIQKLKNKHTFIQTEKAKSSYFDRTRGDKNQIFPTLVCYPTGKNEIYSLKESSTCEYEVVVLTSVLCNHPDYRPEESKER